MFCELSPNFRQRQSSFASHRVQPVWTQPQRPPYGRRYLRGSRYGRDHLGRKKWLRASGIDPDGIVRIRRDLRLKCVLISEKLGLLEIMFHNPTVESENYMKEFINIFVIGSSILLNPVLPN